MNTGEALRALGVTANTLTADQRAAFDRDGFVILPDLLSPEQCRRMAAEYDRLQAREGDKGGYET